MAMEGESENVATQGQESRVLQNNKEERDWSELPNDIIGYIVGKLYWSDRFRVHAVCKSWRRVPLEWIPTIDKAAWLMTYRWMRLDQTKGLIGECKLRDTALGKVMHINRNTEGEVPSIFCQYLCVTSRYGWVLFQKIMYGFDQIYFFLLYSPFTGEVIELPMLDIGYSIHWKLLTSTFYLSSKNSECLVFSMHNHEGTSNISTCRPGDKNWKTYNFLESSPQDWVSYPLSATYVGGCFYCLFASGALGVFDIGSQEWKLLVKRWPGSQLEFYRHGELVAVPRFPCLPYKRHRVMKFDFSAKAWIEDLNFSKIIHPDLRFLSSSEPLGESSTDLHLYAYIYASCCLFRQPSIILIEPPLKCVWRRHHLLNPN